MLKNHLKQIPILFMICVVVLLHPFTYPTIFAQSVADCEDQPIADCIQLEQNSDSINSNTNEENPTINEAGSLFFSILKTIFALLLILGLIYVMVKLLGKRNHFLQQTKVLENLGGISLGNNKSIQMVRIGNKILVIGVGEDIKLLEEITDEVIIEQLLHHDEATNPQGQFFTSILSKIGKEKPVDNDSNRFKNLFSKELHNLKENRQEAIKLQREREN